MVITVLGFFVVAIFIAFSFTIIVKLVTQPFDVLAKALRLSAAGFGVLIYFSARASDISIPDFVLFSTDGTGGFLYKFVKAFAPFAIGAIGSYIILRYVGKIEKGNEKAIYLIISLMSLIGFVSLQAVLETLISSGDNDTLLSSASFIAGILATILFGVDFIGSLRKMLKFEADEQNIQVEDIKTGDPKHQQWRDEFIDKKK